MALFECNASVGGGGGLPTPIDIIEVDTTSAGWFYSNHPMVDDEVYFVRLYNKTTNETLAVAAEMNMYSVMVNHAYTGMFAYNGETLNIWYGSGANLGKVSIGKPQTVIGLGLQVICYKREDILGS